jgi:ABC-type branched-subunit amino acid transport system ATPase component
VIARGKPNAVRDDPVVQRAYLGESVEAVKADA